MQTELYNKLQYVKAYREHRQLLADEVLSRPELFPDLLHLAFEADTETAFKACWILEFVCKERLDWLMEDADYFFSHLKTLRHDSAIRPVAKICEMICEGYFGKKPVPYAAEISETHLNQVAETAFDWLINDEKVAAKAHAMTCLYLIGTRFSWIHPQLRDVLEKDFGDHSAAYRARARHILKKI